MKLNINNISTCNENGFEKFKRSAKKKQLSFIDQKKNQIKKARMMKLNFAM